MCEGAARTAVVDDQVQIGTERVEAFVTRLLRLRAHLGQVHRPINHRAVPQDACGWHGEVGVRREMAAASVPCGKLGEYTWRLEMLDWIRSRQGEWGARPLSAPSAEYKKLKRCFRCGGRLRSVLQHTFEHVVQLDQRVPRLAAHARLRTPAARPLHILLVLPPPLILRQLPPVDTNRLDLIPLDGLHVTEITVQV